MATASEIVKRIKDEEIEWVDLRFTDPKGKWQHLTMVSKVIDEDALEEGLMFDGSSIAGWKTINESDMILKPGPRRGVDRPVQRHPDDDRRVRHRRTLDRRALCA
jgi:glutamine synthetase